MRIAGDKKNDFGGMDDLKVEIQRLFDGSPPKNVDDANRMLGELMERRNSAPQADFGGLSSNSVFKLTRPDWLGSAVLTNPNLTPEECLSSELYCNVVHVLRSVQLQGMVKATATGAFNRKFSTQMYAEFKMDEQRRTDGYRYNKVINQGDVPRLEFFRHLLPVCGLLLFRKGVFTITKLADRLLKSTDCGPLFDLLCMKTFTGINLAALDHMPEAPGIQQTIGYTIYKISRIADDWVDCEDVFEEMLLPAVVETLPTNQWITPGNYLKYRVFTRLQDFGLVERTKTERYADPVQFRKSPLFNRYLTFNLD